MAVSALDSRIFRNLFGTQEIREIFTDEAYVRSLIEVEAALARAEAAVGVIPVDAGKAITEAFASLQIEYVAITSFPAVPEQQLIVALI
jgi:adenylosuccinate lyase